MHHVWETLGFTRSEAHLGKVYEDPQILRQTLYCSPLARKKPNKHTSETYYYYSEWGIATAGTNSEYYTEKTIACSKM